MTRRREPPDPPDPLLMLRRVLGRRAGVKPCPEAALVIDVIVQAAVDAFQTTWSEHQADGAQFLLGPRLESWCDLIGLSPRVARAAVRSWGAFIQLPEAKRAQMHAWSQL